MNWKVLIFDDHCADIVAQVYIIFFFFINIIYIIIIFECLFELESVDF